MTHLIVIYSACASPIDYTWLSLLGGLCFLSLLYFTTESDDNAIDQNIETIELKLKEAMRAEAVLKAQ